MKVFSLLLSSLVGRGVRLGRAWGLAALLGLAGALPAAATHIVGGQPRMTYVRPGIYTLGMTLYFDDVRGNPGALDSVAVLAIYEKRTNFLLDTFHITLTDRQPVAYTNPSCQNNQLLTSQLDYQRDVALNPFRYTSPNGYYLVWERCCRNNTLTNIVRPGAMGQTFYLEFPALRKNGQNFINSSPAAFTPVRDFACVNRLFQTPFGGTDPDGDSLVYALVTPLRGNSDTITVRPVPPLPAPYRRIQWVAGFDSLRQITGPRPLTINRRTGEISFIAAQAGLYVFAVRCTEYRRGVRLGEVRREFQELVVSCPPNQPPDLTLTQIGPPRHSPIYQPGTVLQLPDPPANRCLNLYAVDVEANSGLTLQLIAPGAAPGTLLPSLSVTSGTVNIGGRRDTLMARLCFDDCFGRDGLPLRLGLIVADLACPVPFRDTVWLTVQSRRVPDTPPAIRFADPLTATGYVIRAGGRIAFDFIGTDPDPGARVTVRALNLTTAPLAGLGILCPTVSTTTATATTRLTWDVSCTTPPGDYDLRLQTQSEACGRILTADTIVRVRVVPLPPDTPPTITFPNPATAAGYVVTAGQQVAFDFIGTDVDPDSRVTVQGVNLTSAALKNFGVSCPRRTADGTATTRLTWDVGCDVAAGDYRLQLQTLSEACGRFLTADTLVRVTVLSLDTSRVLPPNIITPNADGLNDTFQPAAGIRPTCNEEFRRLRIFNRWGREVFSSPDRLAIWRAESVSGGLYFYFLEYSNRTYRGWVEVVK